MRKPDEREKEFLVIARKKKRKKSLSVTYVFVLLGRRRDSVFSYSEAFGDKEAKRDGGKAKEDEGVNNSTGAIKGAGSPPSHEIFIRNREPGHCRSVRQ